MISETSNAFPKAIKFGDLKDRNPEYRGDFWKKCRALYAGGPTLLNDEAMLRATMPRHNAEEEGIYKERLSRAFYIPYAGSIIDKIVAELTSKPVIVERAPTLARVFENGSKYEEGDEKLPHYFDEFFADCSKAGGLKTSINQLAREQMLTALQCQSAWTLIDLPRAPELPYANRAIQESSGGLRAYACPVAPENVIDWEIDESGELTFALIYELVNTRLGLTGNRNMITLRWRYYTVDAWAVYELTYDKKKNVSGPRDHLEALLTSHGEHSFGRVPVRRMKLSDGLWAMGKLEAMARAHLNQRNALSWGHLKALFPMPILYASPPNPMDPASEDLGRANQRSGPGYMWILSEKDRLEYFSPDTQPYEAAAADLDRIRDEMHRVLHHMAMSVDNSGAALGRSAESKAIDQVAASVILRALGVILREHLEDVYKTVAAGRKEDLDFSIKGMDTFDDTTISQVIADAMTLESVSIPSATFQKKWKLKVAKLAMGPDATPGEIQEIADELEESITQDSFANAGVSETLKAPTPRNIDGEPPPNFEKVKPKPSSSDSPRKKKSSPSGAKRRI